MVLALVLLVFFFLVFLVFWSFGLLVLQRGRLARKRYRAAFHIVSRIFIGIGLSYYKIGRLLGHWRVSLLKFHLCQQRFPLHRYHK